MDLKVLFPNPDFRKVHFSPKLDFIRIFSPGSTKVAKPDSRYSESVSEFEGESGTQVTVQDPTRNDLDFLVGEVPNGTMLKIEVSLDLVPKRDQTKSERTEMQFMLRNWIVTRLYPWGGAGIQAASRVSRKRGESEPVFNDEVRRRPAGYETLYLGHSDGKYAEPSTPNFASMRVYIKVTDHGGKRLPDPESRTRMEVTLNASGCRHFGIESPRNLVGFKFRKLRKYFLIAKPRIIQPGTTRLLRKNKSIAKVIQRQRTRVPLQLISDVGMHALSDADPKVVRSITGDGPVNKRILETLDNLSRQYRLRR